MTLGRLPIQTLCFCQLDAKALSRGQSCRAERKRRNRKEQMEKEKVFQTEGVLGVSGEGRLMTLCVMRLSLGCALCQKNRRRNFKSNSGAGGSNGTVSVDKQINSLQFILSPFNLYRGQSRLSLMIEN